MSHRILDRPFYLQQDVVHVARELLGKVLVTAVDGVRTSGIITETEAYAGTTDKASHAFGGRRTTRTDPMYAIGGTAYVYLCYGMHHLFNVVTNVEGVPHAVLIRAIRAIEGVGHMRHRRLPHPPTTDGPGTLTTALGIRTRHTGTDLLHGAITIEDHRIAIPPASVIDGPRVGVEYAGADALLPYRFRIAPSHPLPSPPA